MLAVVAGGGSDAVARDLRLLIAQPGYPGTTADAASFVKRLCAFISGHGCPAVAGGEYHNTEAAALEARRRLKPAVGIVSLGLYLAHRRDLKLRAVLWSRPDEPFHIAVAKDRFRSIDELAGKKVTGTPLLEADFVHRVLFAPAAGTGREPASRAWKLKPASLFSRGLRDVTRGRQDAVILTDRERRGLAKLRAAAGLEVIHTTRALPAAVVVRFGGTGPAGEAFTGRLRAAFEAMGRSTEGKEILETMGIAGFAPVDAARLAELEGAWRHGEPVRPKARPAPER